jgi:aminopeptidase N
MKIYALLAAFVLLALPAAAADRVVLPGDVTPDHYDVSVSPDAAARTFTGSVRIDIEVHVPTREIELNAAELAFSHVALSGRDDTPKISYDAKNETATLAFAVPVPAGRYVLSIDYAGKINANAAGLFYLDYDTAQGSRRALFTQFENSDARRFMPCWDEPARKATFTLTATVPSDQMVVSNMPVASESPVKGGLKRVQFEESPRMSSYLLFLAAGDLERVSRKVDGVDVGVVVKRGSASQAQYALDAAAQILPYYERYFDVKYPLPKLDLIAGPGRSQFFGAMENWGAIFFFEGDLLIDPKISTDGDRRDVFITVAHEMAHQWFGDLVTMDWWDGIWLNEGYASWMEYKAASQLHPDWNVWLRAIGSKERAMQVDARAGTHPVIQPIADVFQANQAFDVITYSKGQSVIRMLENDVGEDAFRDGVRAYLKAHAYGNTVTDDLWAAIDKTSPTPITQVAHDFTLQPGIALIRVAALHGKIRLTQDSFAADDNGKASTAWHVPVAEKTMGSNVVWHGIVSRDRPVEIVAPKGATVIVNAGQAGYFRTLYDGTLSGRLAARFAAIAPVDQLGLLNDSAALGLAGYAPAGNFLALAARARPGMDPTVLARLADQLSGIDYLYRDLPGRPVFRAFALKVLKPVFAAVGWMPKPGEDPNAPMLRQSLLDALSQLDDPGVIAAARVRFTHYLKEPSSLSAELRDSVLSIVATHADAGTWEELHKLARTAPTSLEKLRYYELLGRAHDRGLAERSLALTLTDEAPLTFRPSVIRAVSAYYPELAVDFAGKHFDALEEMLEPDSRSEYLPSLAAGSFDPAIIGVLTAYADAHIPPTARQATDKAVAAIAYSAMVRDKRLPEIDRWMKKHR